MANMSFLNLCFFFFNLKPGKLWGKTGLIIYSCAKILGYEMQPSTQRLCREVFTEINDVPYNKKKFSNPSSVPESLKIF